MLLLVYGVTAKRARALEPHGTMILQCELPLTTNPDEASSKIDLVYGFIWPDVDSKKTYFTGKNPFEVSELEVFGVNF